jgi:hypothetical protein
MARKKRPPWNGLSPYEPFVRPAIVHICQGGQEKVLSGRFHIDAVKLGRDHVQLTGPMIVACQ